MNFSPLVDLVIDYKGRSLLWGILYIQATHQTKALLSKLRVRSLPCTHSILGWFVMTHSSGRNSDIWSESQTWNMVRAFSSFTWSGVPVFSTCPPMGIHPPPAIFCTACIERWFLLRLKNMFSSIAVSISN